MLTSEEDVLSPAQQREKEVAAARAAARAAKATKSAAKAQARFPRVASWSSLLPRVGSFSSLGSAAAISTNASQAPTEGARAGRSSEAPPARAPPPELQSPTPAAASTEAPEAVPVSDDIDAWPGQLEGGGIDYRFLSRHLLAAEVRVVFVMLDRLLVGAHHTRHWCTTGGGAPRVGGERAEGLPRRETPGG